MPEERADDLMVMPSEDEVEELRRLSVAVDRAEAVCLQVDKGDATVLPPAARAALGRALAYLAHGTPVAINPVDSLLTTQEAADFLGVSRPHLVTLLERGELGYQRGLEERAHRRVALRDLMEYASRVRTRKPSHASANIPVDA
jgi:excisionase family DNA binding protein